MITDPTPDTVADPAGRLRESLKVMEEQIVKLERLPATSRDRQHLGRETIWLLAQIEREALRNPTLALDLCSLAPVVVALRDRVREMLG